MVAVSRKFEASLKQIWNVVAMIGIVGYTRKC